MYPHGIRLRGVCSAKPMKLPSLCWTVDTIYWKPAGKRSVAVRLSLNTVFLDHHSLAQGGLFTRTHTWIHSTEDGSDVGGASLTFATEIREPRTIITLFHSDDLAATIIVHRNGNSLGHLALGRVASPPLPAALIAERRATCIRA